jgi:hypothetical protein
MARLIGLACVLAATFAAEADVGVGVSGNGHDTTVYVPITPGRLMLEPYFRFADSDSSEVGLRWNPELPIPTNSVSESDSYSIGMGIFGLLEPAERVTIYYGGRLARIKRNASSASLLAPANFAPSTVDADGYSIAPTVGIQYQPIERFSVGAEIGWDYSEVEDVSMSSGPAALPRGTTTRTITTKDSRADIVLRFFF